MVGEDAVSVYTQLLMKFIDLLSKIGEEHRQNKSRKPVKIRHGSLSRSDFSKLMENGAEFKFVSAPTQDANAVEQCAKDLGGSFFRVDTKDTETDTAMFAVPKSQIDLMNIAIKRTISESLTNTPDKLMVREGKDSIAGEDMPLVSDIMNRFDIPVMPFKNKNGEYTVIVPTEYEGQYQQAIERVNEIKSKMKNVDVISFTQHGDLKEPEYLARELSKDEAAELSRKIKSQGLDIKISKYEDKLYAVYDRNTSDNINNIIDGYQYDLHESDEYLLTLNDNSITIDKQTLLVGENEDEYFLRVPNTHGVDHIKLKKSEVEEINDGRTLRVRLN